MVDLDWGEGVKGGKERGKWGGKWGMPRVIHTPGRWKAEVYNLRGVFRLDVHLAFPSDLISFFSFFSSFHSYIAGFARCSLLMLCKCRVRSLGLAWQFGT